MRDPPLRSIAAKLRVVERFVIDAEIGGDAGGAEPVDGDPGQDLVVGPGVGVGPVVQLFVDPGQEADGAVREGVAECLRFGLLFPTVAAAFREEPVAAGVAGLFARGRGGEGMLGGEDGVGEEAGSVAADHVDVGSHDVLRVEEAHDAGYHAAPVAALRDYVHLLSGLVAKR